MELRLPTSEQLSMVYERDLRASFPPAELKPLAAIERMWQEGWYLPYCLFDGEEIAGEAFLWLGHPGYALLDYLCVSSQRRNSGLGASLLKAVSQVEPGWVIFGESETPAHAPDPVMAERRLGFYRRNGLRTAGYETQIFGVRYKTLYLAAEAVEDQVLLQEHRFVYKNTFSPEKYARYVRIPYDETRDSGEMVPWQQ